MLDLILEKSTNLMKLIFVLMKKLMKTNSYLPTKILILINLCLNSNGDGDNDNDWREIQASADKVELSHKVKDVTISDKTLINITCFFL